MQELENHLGKTLRDSETDTELVELHPTAQDWKAAFYSAHALSATLLKRERQRGESHLRLWNICWLSGGLLGWGLGTNMTYLAPSYNVYCPAFFTLLIAFLIVWDMQASRKALILKGPQPKKEEIGG
jgi:hypothetical protein